MDNTKPMQNITDICKDILGIIKSSNDLINIDNSTFELIQKCISSKNTEKLKNDTQYTHLYPHLDDINFSKKISEKKEFNDAKFDEFDNNNFDDIENITNKLCSPNREFELEPHQIFVRNFLSFQTPYNSLLLYHGLGTGKTCSSISVCEEMRSYLQQLGINRRIIIVASSVVQENYKLQLFDARKLKNINGLWNIKSCTGNKFIKEINPMNMKGLTKDKVVQQINRIISQSYLFLGYTEFANYINRIINKNTTSKNEKKRRQQKIRAIRNEFSNRLLIIDEVHNVRNTNSLKRTSKNLLELITYSVNMKLLLLTATPMFNDYKEIVWLLNLMNLNDNRFPVKISDIFDANGDFVVDEENNEIGKNLFIQKMIGYVSFVKGENPFKFPYRVWPNNYNNPSSIIELTNNQQFTYPKYQINDVVIDEPIKYLDIIITDIKDQQLKAYNFIIEELKKNNPILRKKSKGLQYTITDGPLQALNITYPHEKLEDDTINGNESKFLYGKDGLKRTMLSDKGKGDFEYKPRYLNKYGRFFSIENLDKYSAKLYKIMKSIINSKGIILIYSQYIGGGCVPIALALEELGLTRFGNRKNLFKTSPTEPIDSITLKPSLEKDFNPAKYVMITGDKKLSPNNKEELKASTNPNNINGEIVKVIIISKAGSEGLDFKNIRQIHLLEPWYNLNRTDQVIGRGVRNLSHCQLPYKERNTQIFLYGTNLNNELEAIDLYMYRLAENKGIQIGKITRLLKEYAIDCILNKPQISLSEDIINKTVSQNISSTNQTINFRLGDKNDSIICDFTNCEYTCKPNNNIDNIYTETYSENFIVMNLDKIMQRIKLLFKEKYVYEKNELINSINAIKKYPRDQILTGLNSLINDKTEYLIDMLGRQGRLVNIDNYYLFQPIELENKNITNYQRTVPLNYNRNKLSFVIPQLFEETKNEDGIDETKSENKIDNNLLDTIKNKYDILINPGHMNVKNKNTWESFAGWSINNLNKYNFIEKDVLISYAMEHIFDVLNLNDKLHIFNLLYYKEKELSYSEEFIQKLKSITEKYIINSGTYKGVVITNYNTTSKYKYKIYTFSDEKLIFDPESIRKGLGKELINTNVIDKDLLNTDIGFLTNFKNKNIVFKNKNMLSKRAKGLQCSKGESKGAMINRINMLHGYQKYITQKTNIISIVDKNQQLFNKNEIVQLLNSKDKSKKKTEIKISTGQLCAENELLLRHFDSIKKNDKIWFLDSLKSTVNNIA